MKGREGSVVEGLWDDTVNLSLLSYSLQSMDFMVTSPCGLQWRLTGIYGYPEEHRKEETGRMMMELEGKSALPWMCVGHFNGILSHEEKVVSNPKHQHEIDGCREAVRRCNLSDIHFEGFPYTWTNNRADTENIQERLDRALVSETWYDMFPCSKVKHLPRRKSDHFPIKVFI